VNTTRESIHCTPRKFAAALQNNPGQIDPVLLYTDFDGGHGYGKSKEQTIRDLEYKLRFVFSQLGIRQPLGVSVRQ